MFFSVKQSTLKQHIFEAPAVNFLIFFQHMSKNHSFIKYLFAKQKEGKNPSELNKRK